MDLILLYYNRNNFEFAIEKIRGVLIASVWYMNTFLFVFADSLQAQLINMGVIPTLVKLLGIHCQNAALTEMCLVAFGNLAELGKS